MSCFIRPGSDVEGPALDDSDSSCHFTPTDSSASSKEKGSIGAARGTIPSEMSGQHLQLLSVEEAHTKADELGCDAQFSRFNKHISFSSFFPCC